MMTTICLAASGLVIAWLTPLLMRQQGHRGDAPGLAVVAWFAGASTTVLLWLAAAAHLMHSSGLVGRLFGAALVAAVVTRLGWVVINTVMRTRRLQREHLATAQIVARRDIRPGVLVIDTAEPTIYCVPSASGAIVMSRGAHELLTDTEVAAVLVHERAHLREHHHLLVTVAGAMHAAFPWLRSFRHMRAQVALLLEMRADDAAVRAHGADTVIDALAALCLRDAPAGTLAAHGRTVLHRVTRLTAPASLWRTRIGTLATLATALILAGAPLLGPWLPLCPHPLV
jgi:Zn-dependent protease with chaperone function